MDVFDFIMGLICGVALSTAAASIIMLIDSRRR